MSIRIGMGARQRFLILKRDNFVCQYCGARAPHAELQVDHIVPVAKGGTNESSNLITACWLCNIGKGTTDDPAPIAVVITSLTQQICDHVRKKFPKEYRAASVFPWVRRHLELQENWLSGSIDDVVSCLEYADHLDEFTDGVKESVEQLVEFREFHAKAAMQ